MQKAFIWTLLLVLATPVQVFAAIQGGRWHPGIGDPTWTGWLTVLMYCAAAVCAVRQYRKHRKLGIDAKFWLLLIVLLVFLGINKQLDLQSWFTEVMKQNAMAHGWYSHRHTYQYIFVVVVGFAMLLLLLLLRLRLAASWRRFRLTWLGLVLLGGFIIVRMASFHHVDILINQHVLGIKLNALLELSALLLVIIGTFYHNRLVAPIIADTISIRDYVDIAREGDPVKCPNCGTPPLSKAIGDRQFKCRKCGHHYYVRKI